MQISLTHQAEEAIRSLMASGDSVDQIVEQALIEKMNREQAANSVQTGLSFEIWEHQFRDFLGRQISMNPHFDDSRESMYPDR